VNARTRPSNPTASCTGSSEGASMATSTGTVQRAASRPSAAAAPDGTCAR
jgi:hypothetical protein